MKERKEEIEKKKFIQEVEKVKGEFELEVENITRVNNRFAVLMTKMSKFHFLLRK